MLKDTIGFEFFFNSAWQQKILHLAIEDILDWA